MKAFITAILVVTAWLALAQMPPFPKTKVKPLLSPKAAAVAKSVPMKAALAAAAATVEEPTALSGPFPPPDHGTGRPYYFVHYDNPSAPIVMGVTGYGDMILIVPEEAPRLRIPNPTKAPFTKLESSTDLVTWKTLGYFTNFTWDFYIADVAATNKVKNFYRLVPQ